MGSFSLNPGYGKVEKSPACGGNGTRHTVDIIEDGRDTIPPHLTRIHTTTPTYSHHTTAFFSHTPVPHASDHERHGDTPPTPSSASAQPGTTPGPGPTDRAPAESSPGLPTPPHPLGPHGPPRDQHMANPSTAPRARARPPRRPPPAPPALRAHHPHRRVRRRHRRPLPWPCGPPRAVVPARERREQRVRAGMMGSRAPGSRH